MVENKTAIVFGATGLIGKHVLTQLLAHKKYSRIIAVSRKTLPISDPRLSVVITSLDKLDELGTKLKADDVFCCLGTTRKKTPDLSTYYQIDHDFVVNCAKATHAQGASSFSLVSAVGAHALSKNFYLKTKGEAERDVVAIGFIRTHIFRPSLLIGEREEVRLMETLAKYFAYMLNGILWGGLRKYRSIQGAAVAKAMLTALDSSDKGVSVYHWKEIKALT